MRDPADRAADDKEAERGARREVQRGHRGAERKIDIGILAGRVECRSFDPVRNILLVSFRIALNYDFDAPEEEADGLAKCRVVSENEFAARRTEK